LKQSTGKTDLTPSGKSIFASKV